MSGHVLAEDKTYDIEHVDIHVEVNEEGILHVSERSTFTFDGKFNGTERSILADVDHFKAYEIEDSINDPNRSTEGLEELKTENKEDLYRIYMSAEDEQKTVLYTYDIKNEVKKYTDVADLMVDFYPSSDEVDLGTLTITWEFGSEAENAIHAFIRGDQQGTVEVNGSEVVYQHHQFESGMSSEVRLVFPAKAIPNMALTKDKSMGKEIIQDEQLILEKRDKYEDRLGNLMPIAMIVWIILIGGMIWWYVNHPNNYKFGKNDEPIKQLPFLEETDPLFVSYIHARGYVSQMQTGIISALLSLKRRGIISMEEIPSKKDTDTMTFGFYWDKAKKGIDEVDTHLRRWLFKEENEQEQFIFESIIVDEDEDKDIQKEKQEDFTTHYNEWMELVKHRKAFSGWYEPYRPFKYVSILLTILTFGLFYYIVSISAITSGAFQLAVVGMSILGIVSVIWSRNKWVLSAYYAVLIITLLIVSTWSMQLLPILGIIIVSGAGLLIVSSRKWDQEVAKLVSLSKIALKFFKQKEYPVAEDEIKNERRLELAITLGMSKEFADQIGKQLTIEKMQSMNTPLLNNPSFAGHVFHPSNVIFYTAMSSSSSSSTSIGSSPTGGSGGAGAF